MENEVKSVGIKSKIKSFHDQIFNTERIKDSKRRRILALIIFYLSSATIFLTIFSQMPMFSSYGITKIFQLGWIVLLIPMLVLDYRLLLRSAMNALILVVPFLIYSIIALVLGVNVFAYSGTNNIFLCLFIFSVGIFFGKYFNIKSLKAISFVFIVSTVFLAAIVYLKKIKGNIDQSEIYAYDDKNSSGPIFLSAGILSFFVFDKNKKSHYIIKIGLFSALAVLIVVAKCRASVFCIPVVLLVIHIFLPKNKKSKILSRTIFPAACALVVIMLFSVPYLYQKIVVHFFLNDKKTLEEALSGRLQLIKEAINLFTGSNKNMLIGTGGHYVDCMPVSLIVSYGIFGLICLLPVALIPWYSIFRSKKKVNNYLYFIVEISVLLTLYINSIFEGHGFFGPGSKVFLLWFIAGCSFFLLIKVPKEAPKIALLNDKPARFISKIKPKPFSIIFQLALIGGSIVIISSKSLVQSFGDSVFKYIPDSRLTDPLSEANEGVIDTEYLKDNLGFNTSGNISGNLCLGQKIKLKENWENKEENSVYSRAWYKPSWNKTDSCSVDSFNGVVSADEVETSKECIIQCAFSRPKGVEGPYKYLRIKVVEPTEYTFSNTMIDVKPFEYSFELSDTAKNSKENPIIINKGMTKKIFYDKNYLPSNNDGVVTYEIEDNYENASIDNTGILKLKNDAQDGDKFCVKGIINYGKSNNQETVNKLWFKVGSESADGNVNSISLKEFPKKVYQYTPYDIDVTFNEGANDKTYDLKVKGTDIRDSDYKIDYDDDGNAKRITFNKSTNNVNITVTSRSNSEKTDTKTIDYISLNNPIKITCSLDHMWMKVGERKTAKELGLKLVFENGYEKILDDNDLEFDAVKEYGDNPTYTKRATQSKNGFYNGSITNVSATVAGTYTYPYTCKLNTSLVYKMSITCNVLGYNDYVSSCINIGIILTFLIIIPSMIFLLGVEINKKIFFVLMTGSFTFIVALLVILLYSTNVFTIVSVITFIVAMFLYSILRLVFFQNKNIKIIDNVAE